MADLITGADAVGGEAFCDDIYNSLKNHWRADYGGDPCGELSGIQPGMIVNDSYDNRLYLALLESGCACSEILQSCVPLSDDKTIDFGNDADSSIGYETTNEALIFGIPVSTGASGDNKRGLIFCDEADIGMDFTGLLGSSLQPRIALVDLDTDSYLGFSFASDDTPEIRMQSEAYYNLIQTSQAEGLAGADLRIGLDPALRTMVICDRGDIATDFGNAVAIDPTLQMRTAVGIVYTNYSALGTISNTNLHFQGAKQNNFYIAAANNNLPYAFRFSRIAPGSLTDADAEQAWVYVEPLINQTLTAGYIGILLNVTETSLGDASGGAGYNALMDLRVATVSKFMIDNSGGIFPAGMKSGANQGAAGAVAGELWWDTDDNLVKMGV